MIFYTYSQEKPGLYASNGVGMIFDSISSTSDSEYVASVTVEGLNEKTILYRNGKAIKTKTRSFTSSGTVIREATEEEGNITEETIYDDKGFIQSEKFFKINGEIEEKNYTYVDGKLLYKTIKENGKTIDSYTYIYSPEGRLVSLKRQDGSSLGQSLLSNKKSTMWFSKGQELELREYDEMARLVLVNVYNGSDFVRQEKNTWNDSVLVSSETRFADDSLTISTYITDGKAKGKVSKIEYKPKGTVEIFVYDDNRNITCKKTKNGIKEDMITYAYNQENVLILEKRYISSLLSMQISYEDDLVIIEYYDAGELFAKTYTKNEKKIKEEMFINNKIIKTRTFQ